MALALLGQLDVSNPLCEVVGANFEEQMRATLAGFERVCRIDGCGLLLVLRIAPGVLKQLRRAKPGVPPPLLLLHVYLLHRHRVRARVLLLRRQRRLLKWLRM